MISLQFQRPGFSAVLVTTFTTVFLAESDRRSWQPCCYQHNPVSPGWCSVVFALICSSLVEFLSTLAVQGDATERLEQMGMLMVLLAPRARSLLLNASAA